jgi:hypothetical protein
MLVHARLKGSPLIQYTYLFTSQKCRRQSKANNMSIDPLGSGPEIEIKCEINFNFLGADLECLSHMREEKKLEPCRMLYYNRFLRNR